MIKVLWTKKEPAPKAVLELSAVNRAMNVTHRDAPAGIMVSHAQIFVGARLLPAEIRRKLVDTFVSNKTLQENKILREINWFCNTG